MQTFYDIFERKLHLLIINHAPVAIIVLYQGRKSFDPIAGVQISDTVDHAVFRAMDVAAYDALAAFGTGHVGKHPVKI